MLLWYLIPGRMLLDLIDLYGLASLTRSGFPWCTTARAIPRQFCHGCKQREAMAHYVVCSESQDLNINEGLSCNHNTRCCDISGFWNRIVYLFTEKFYSAKASSFFNQPKAFSFDIDFPAFSMLLTSPRGWRDMSRYMGGQSNCGRGRRTCLLFSVDENKSKRIFCSALRVVTGRDVIGVLMFQVFIISLV